MFRPFAMIEINGRPEEGVSDLATTAEEADAADHGRRDRVEQERAATLVEVHRLEPRREDDSAEPAMTPEIMKTMMRTRATLMPARRAASALPPTAYTWRPKRSSAWNVSPTRKTP